MLEVYKCLKNENPSFMWNMFQEKSIQYNLRSRNLLMLPQTNTIKYGNDSIVFEAASYGITFLMKLKAKPPSALLRNV